MPKIAMQTLKFALDSKTSRIAAPHFDEDAVMPFYRGTQEKLIGLLNQALATELVCALCYTRQYYTVRGEQHSRIKSQFLKHAVEEQRHADLIAERIVQLNGEPDFNPSALLAQDHTGYDDNYAVQAMVMTNLIAERTSIETYRQMLNSIGDIDPTTTRMLLGIMAIEEEHAADMRSLLR